MLIESKNRADNLEYDKQEIMRQLDSAKSELKREREERKEMEEQLRDREKVLQTVMNDYSKLKVAKAATRCDLLKATRDLAGTQVSFKPILLILLLSA